MEFPAVRFKTTYYNDKHFITIEVPRDQWEALQFELSTFKNDQACVKFSRPKRPRTCGPKSQNSHAWGHCAQIAQSLGMEVYEVEYIAKYRAIKRGYPVFAHLGMMVPKSQADIDTVECGYLIEECHQIAAENNIILTETEPEILAKPEGFYRDPVEVVKDIFGGEVVDTNTLKAPEKVSAKSWYSMTREEQKASDPARYDEEMNLQLF